MSIKIEALRVFAAVADHGNISIAANALGRTPSAVSMTLKQLEKSLGGSLFEGERKHQLTELGRFTREVATVQLTSYSRAIDAIKAFARNATGHISVACVRSQVNLLLPAIISRFTVERPDVTLDWLDEDNASIAEKVADQAVDLGIAEEPPDGLGLLFEPLLDDPYQVWFSRHCPLARFSRPLTWRDLRHLTLIRSPISDSLRAESYRNMAAKAQLRVSDPVALCSLIESNAAVAILPVLPVLASNPLMHHRPLADPRARRQLGLIRSGTAPARPGVEIFSALLRSHFQNNLTIASESPDTTHQHLAGAASDFR